MGLFLMCVEGQGGCSVLSTSSTWGLHYRKNINFAKQLTEFIQFANSMSGFFKSDEEYSATQVCEIDFDEAERLSVSGSTCEVYKTRWQRRDVFVKRLKAELRAKPIYLDALEKEFEIGVRLTHPSLPVYHEFHGDYIVMDYVDGTTLAEMISGDDSWLASEKNIVAMLRQLIDVVDYLHRHNVVHCDIKADNIMITHKCKNLMLIDFDKCYTDALPDTAGHPALYGVSGREPGSMAIDFNGIARLLARLKAEVKGFKFRRYRRFIKALHRPNVECSELIDLLSYDASAHIIGPKWGLSGVLLLAVLAAGGYLLLNRGTAPGEAQEPLPSVAQGVDSAAVVAVSVPHEVAVKADSGRRASASQQNVPLTQEQLLAQAREKAKILDRRIEPSFAELQLMLSQLSLLKDDASVGASTLLQRVTALDDKEQEYVQEAFQVLYEIFPGISEREAWRIMAYSEQYTGYKRRAAKVMKAVDKEYKRRLMAEAPAN